jgi:cell division protein FtsX
MAAQDIIKDTIQMDFMTPFPFSMDTVMTHILFYAISITIVISCVFLSIMLIKSIIKQFKRHA